MTDCGRSWDGSKVPDTVEKLTWALRSLLRFDFAAPLLLDVVANFEKNHRLRRFSAVSPLTCHSRLGDAAICMNGGFQAQPRVMLNVG
jgi:hypothetical protein